MGLDVRVYKKIKKVSHMEHEHYDFIAHVIDDKWRDRVKNLEYGAKYVGDSSGFLISYPCRTHNDFRRALCKMIGLDENAWSDRVLDSNTPFFEFFEFADNDGCMDWETSKKLKEDFKNNCVLAEEKLSTDNLEYYMLWFKVFMLASDNGVVVYR